MVSFKKQKAITKGSGGDEESYMLPARPRIRTEKRLAF
jgi:hypothetical protein